MGQVRENGLVHRLLPGLLVLKSPVRSQNPRSLNDAVLATKLMADICTITHSFCSCWDGDLLHPQIDPFDISVGRKVFLISPKLQIPRLGSGLFFWLFWFFCS